MGDLITVAFANNDDNGNETERVEAVELGDDSFGRVELCCQMPHGQVFRRSGPPQGGSVVCLRVGRQLFSSWGWTTWHGNMAWNSTRMARPEAERLLRFLLACGYTVDAYDDGPFAKIVEEHERTRSAP